MHRPTFFSHMAYVFVGMISLLLAVFVSSQVVKKSYSQESPSDQTAAIVPLPPPPPPPSESASPEETSSSSAKATPQAISSTFLEPFVFDTREGRRNPFRAPLLELGSAPDIVLPGTPLERYELDELRVAAIMWDVKNPKAMILDPKGEVHILGKDDRIGRHRGYVAVIREGELVIVESTNFNGETTFSTRVMRIDK